MTTNPIIKTNMNFQRISQRSVGDVTASVYELDLESTQTLQDFEGKLLSKIQRMKIHRDLIDDDFLDLLAPIASENFKNTVNEKASAISRPQQHPIVAFDVRRSRVTEFMSHLLLEDEYSCIFHEITDKRQNLEHHRANEHVRGIDVTGIKGPSNNLRFVVCEVKATSSTRSPSTSTTALLEDVMKAYENSDERLTKEIVDMITRLKEDVAITSDEIKNIVNFLLRVLSEVDSKKMYLERVIFFPFLIKQNLNGASIESSREFQPFQQSAFPGTEVQGVIWSFNKNIDDFCNDLYERAIQ